MRVIITGKSGYISNNLKFYLEKNNFDVDLLSVRNNNVSDLNIDGYDVIVHCAGIVHQSRNINEKLYFSINTELTSKLAEHSKKSGIKHFIFISTMNVYGINSGNINSNTKENPVSLYGKSKYDAEIALNALADSTFKISVLRPPMVYGNNCPGNYHRLSALAKLTPLFPKVDNKRSMIYIENLCEFINIIAHNRLDGLFFPQNDEFVNTSEMVKKIAEVNNKKILMVNAFGNILKNSNIGLLQKLFSDLTYSMELSNPFDYNIVDFDESIYKSELNKL